MCAYVIGVVRSATRLDALTYEAKAPGDLDQPWKRDERCELRPLPSSSRPELWSAWRAIESVNEWTESTLAHVLVVLRETVASSDVPGDLAALGSHVHAPPEPRATAAHPRAFKGTKHQPPKQARPEPVDVRPYLLTRRHADMVLEQLGQPRGIDPYVAWNHGVDAAAGFDPAFVMYLLPLLRTCTWSDVGAFAALARTMELHVRPELRAALTGVFVAAGDATRALGWWSHVLAHEPDQRHELAQLVSASGVATIAPIDPAFAAQIAGLPAVQRWSIYRGLVGGASPEYIASGLELGAISEEKPDEVPPGKASVTSVIVALTERLDTAMDEDSGSEFWRTHLWTLCGKQPGFLEFLSSPNLSKLTPEAGFWAVRIASSPRWWPEQADSLWRFLCRQIDLFVEQAVPIPPEYQRKFVEDMGDVFWWAVDTDHVPVDALAKCVDLCVRAAKAPFVTKATLGSVYPSMALVYSSWELWPERHEIRDAPDSSWLALEDACKRTNDMRLLAYGLNRLSQFATKLLVSTFVTSPAALFQTATSLASISFEAANDLVDAYSATDLAKVANDAPLETLCALIEPVARAGGPNPIRRALREHLSGEKTLTDEQVRGHRERIVADLGIVRLAAIRQAVERQLAGRIGASTISTPTMRHALEMLTNVGIHRRQLKRMLSATAAGDAQWRLRHPRTIEWLSRHPKIDRDTWTRGVELGGEVEGVGGVRLATEQDPLEALKLGTYVGSCLGRGGSFQYSAAAVVLDINKQVVYARDMRGSVVGRQLVAISEADELVCFEVYGTTRPALLQPLFRDYDRRLSERLGVPLAKGVNDGTYEIASVLSRSWWDDGAWSVE